MSDENIQSEVDALGLTCPEPVMMLHAAIRDVALGDVVKVLATDPSTEKDIANFCEFLGHTLISCEQEGDVRTFLVSKGVR